MRIVLLVIFIGFLGVDCSEYFGTHVGRIRNASFALDGEVYLVNSTHLQILDFTMKRVIDRSHIQFVFTNDEKQEVSTSMFEYKDEDRTPWLKAYTKPLQDGVPVGRRMILKAPSDLKNWKFFGVANTDQAGYIAIIPLNKPAPAPYCCIGNGSEQYAIEGEYGVRVDPIVVLDAKTLRLPNFNFQGTKPPDGWIFAGIGEILQESGKKALILGRDEEHKHCAMHEDYHNADLTVRLRGDQTVYDIDWISVFCYKYEHDFGHVAVNLIEKNDPVPAYLPPVRTGAAARVRRIKCD